MVEKYGKANVGQFGPHIFARTDMLAECGDLIDNGYRIILKSFQTDFWMMKLKHHANGRTLIAKWRDNYYTLSEGKKVLKKVSY